MQTNIIFKSSTETMEALLESFFNHQIDEHVKVYRFHLYSSKYDAKAVGDGLNEAVRKLVALRKQTL